MAEIKCYPLAVPVDEVYEHWMGNKTMEEVLEDINVLCVYPDPGGLCHYFMFRTTKDRTDAYNKIHEAYPDSLCAYIPIIAYIDSKELKKARGMKA